MSAPPPRLSTSLKEKLIQQALARKLQAPAAAPAAPRAAHDDIPEAWWRWHLHPGWQHVRILQEGAQKLGVASPFFKLHDGIAGATTHIGGAPYINYASYNYLDLSGDACVMQAAQAAMQRWGTSVSASRLVSGERPVHRELESALANLYGVDDAIALVSGHAANVTTIGHLFGPRDLVLHDALIHNSVLQGVQLSGAHRLAFPHNDWQALDALLVQHRRQFERVLVVIEGVYSMDGDCPELPRFIEVKHRHRAFLMVDEAHALGVLGSQGGGSLEHGGVAGREVDIWMGTLSKTLASCGGYIAGERALVQQLKFLAPGFLYSVGMPPPVAAAALAALRRMQQLPERVAAVQARGRFFLAQAQAAGLNTGSSRGMALVPVIVGSSLKATRLAAALFAQGIHVQPILYPAVPEQSARLRFFLSCMHTEEQIAQTVAATAQALRRG